MKKTVSLRKLAQKLGQQAVLCSRQRKKDDSSLRHMQFDSALRVVSGGIVLRNTHKSTEEEGICP